MKDIKTKSTVKDIKVLDKSADVSRRMKNAYIRTKAQAEQPGYNDNSNYVDDAGNSILEGTETLARKAGHTAGSYSKKTIEKVKGHHNLEHDTPYSDAFKEEQAQQPPTSEGKETMHRNTTRKETKLATEQSAASGNTKEAVKPNASHPNSKQAAKQNVIQSRAKVATNRKFTLSKPNELAKRRFVQSRVEKRFSQTSDIWTADQIIYKIQSQQISERLPSHQSFFKPAKKAAVQTLTTSGKTGRTIKKYAGTGSKTVKESVKGSIKRVKKSVKTAEHTAKSAIKTSEAVAKTAAKTAIKSAKATQRTVQAARAAAKVAAVSAKMAAKAIIATIKAILVAVKGTVTLIAAGGWIAVVVILVICLVGFLLGSGFGIFFSNESASENTPLMTEVVSRLNEEFSAEIQQIQDENPHDTLNLSGSIGISASCWSEILAVYAVKVTFSPENGMEVATLDDAKVQILRDVFWDMNKIDYWIETIEHEETVTTTDDEGNVIEETITTTETILHINVTSKSHTDMIAEYGFNLQQVKMLNELMQDEYQELFMQLIGS